MAVNKKVLVCDDELHILESVTYVVREEGYAVVTAEDGEQALRVAQAEKPDLMLLDVMMPKKNGFEVCGALKADPLTHGIYIILLTSMGQERDAEQGYQSGADEYMTKPFSPRSLRKKLHELLD
ncbi:MAG TPA: response regulator [Bryobacterales bacterium]|nr:response regulator [Bryobacterales bacterium]